MQWLYRNFEYLISSAAFTVMVGIISLNVGMRYFANYSMPFAEEISYFGFDYVVFFGATMLYRMHGLIAVTVIVDRLPMKLRRLALITNFVILVLANSYLFLLGWDLCAGSWERKSAYLEFPYFYINAAPTIAFGLMALYSLNFLRHAVFGAPVESFSDASIEESE
nr:TRAP transporter small permease [uncultured Cohaesibacter sp.]